MLQGYVHPDFGHVAEILNNQIPRNRPGGAALTVYHKGQCVVDIWGGTRNRDGDPWQSDTLSMSFSTSKGVVSALLHALADDGLIEFDEPVTRYWPEFGQKGKQDITLRQLLCHEAGLWHIREMIDDAERMLDWHHMTRALEQARPMHKPGATHGYHALTFGWLVGEVVRRVTGKTFSQVLHERLILPLGLDGLYIGLPEHQMARRAELVTRLSPAAANGLSLDRNLQRVALRLIGQGLKAINIDLDQTISALIPKGVVYLDVNHRDFANACIPSVNGMFTARSLGKLYAALANGGEIEGVRLLSRRAVQNMMEIQNRTVGEVIPVPMHWRLGYHRVFAMGADTSTCFGHFGLGGSGAWADPVRNLSMGLVLNNGIGTPFGDSRIIALSSAILRCAEKRYVIPDAEQIRGIGPFFPRERRQAAGPAKQLFSGVLPRRRRSDFDVA